MLDDSFTSWVEDEVRKLAEQGWAPGGPRQEYILKTWRRDKPAMCRRLGPDLLVKLAFVVDNLRYRSKLQYIKAGLDPAEAELEATKDWLMLEPEDDRDDAVLAEAYTPWPTPSE